MLPTSKVLVTSPRSRIARAHVGEQLAEVAERIPRSRMLLPAILPPNTSDSTLPSNVSTLFLSVMPGMLAASLPETPGQPNAFASFCMLMGSTSPLNETSMSAAPRLPNAKCSMSMPPSNTGSRVGRVSAKFMPCATNSSSAAPP